MLAKIVGVYRIGYRNSQTNTALKQDLLVIENLFYDRNVKQVRTKGSFTRHEYENDATSRMGPNLISLESWRFGCPPGEKQTMTYQYTK